MKIHYKDQGHNKVLPVQGYHTLTYLLNYSTEQSPS